jgi:hypothetical protein
MKKLFVLLGSLAVIILLASCANAGTAGDYGTFTVRDWTEKVPNDKIDRAVEHGCEKNDDDEYVYHKYYLTDASNSEYKKYINRDIFYKNENGSSGNMYYTSCKDKVIKMLEEGSFTELKNQSWLGYDTLILNSYPQ